MGVYQKWMNIPSRRMLVFMGESIPYTGTNWTFSSFSNRAPLVRAGKQCASAYALGSVNLFENVYFHPEKKSSSSPFAV